MTKLVCPDCQHENEAERIYCHNCGARLDRSSVLKEKIAEGKTEVAARQHLKKMFSPGRGRGKRLALQLAQTILGALSTAAVIVMLLPPTDFPPEKKDYSFAPMINMDIVSAISSQQPATLVYNEEQVNSYLASNLRRKDSPAKEGFFPLRRILVRFQEGVCAINTERQLFGLSIYSGSSYRVKVVKGKISAASTAGYIGRMPIHPELMKFADIILQKAWTTLEREHNSVAKLSGIEFHPQVVTLIAGR